MTVLLVVGLVCFVAGGLLGMLSMALCVAASAADNLPPVPQRAIEKDQGDGTQNVL